MSFEFYSFYSKTVVARPRTRKLTRVVNDIHRVRSLINDIVAESSNGSEESCFRGNEGSSKFNKSHLTSNRMKHLEPSTVNNAVRFFFFEIFQAPLSWEQFLIKFHANSIARVFILWTIFICHVYSSLSRKKKKLKGNCQDVCREILLPGSTRFQSKHNARRCLFRY